MAHYIYGNTISAHTTAKSNDVITEFQAVQTMSIAEETRTNEAIKFPAGSADQRITENASQRAEKSLGFDAGGNLFMYPEPAISATAAAASADAAALSETAAGDSETAAGNSETAAGNSASSASSSAGTATTQAGIATSAAGTATTQAGIATTQAGTATTQAGIATTQAGTATTQAGIATTQAGLASGFADAADFSATAAAASQGLATNAASAASLSAAAASDSADAAAASAATLLNTKVLEIGNWDMNESVGGTQQIIAHGISLASKIRTISVVIRNDSLSAYYPFASSSQLTTGGNMVTYDGTSVYLRNTVGNAFDNTGFDNVTNRGWVTIQYTD